MGLTLLGVVLGLSGCGGSGLPEAGPVSTQLPESPAPATPEQLRAFLSGYSWADNTPEHSSDISNPVVHSQAGGTGTYDDPITVGVGHVVTDESNELDWPAGTLFYVPNLRRYLVVEDTCGDGDRPQDGPCHVGYPSDASTWLNVWVGGEGDDSENPRRCMQAIEGVWTVLVDPEPGFAVDPGPIFQPAGCAHQYGDDLVTPTS